MGHYIIEPNAWDAMVSIYAHVSLHARRRLHAQVIEGLRPGGAFVLEGYMPAQVYRNTGGPGPGAIDITMAPDDLRDEQSGLRIETLREVEREVHESPYHTGLASVVQMLAWRGA
ncbi:MAG: hypothetical protein AAF624_07400 [Bacteroidota bacterium]